MNKRSKSRESKSKKSEKQISITRKTEVKPKSKTSKKTTKTSKSISTIKKNEIPQKTQESKSKSKSKSKIIVSKSQEQQQQPIQKQTTAFLDFSYLKQYNIEVVSRIGKGGYGLVYKAYRGQKPLAMKINYDTVGFQTQFIEMGILKILQNSQHSCKLIQILNVRQQLHIVTQFVEHQHNLSYSEHFEPEEIKFYMHNLLLGLKQLKQYGIIHKDIKPSNFLYDPSRRVGKIVDFGAAMVQQSFIKNKINTVKKGSHEQKLYINILKVQQNKGKRYGTNPYSPLEVLLKADQSYSVDIWSAGIMFLQLLVKKYVIFMNFVRSQNLSSQNQFLCSFLIQLCQIFGNQVIEICDRYGYQLKLPSFSRKISFKSIVKKDVFGEECLDLLSKMLVLVPENRITPQDALNHPYFSDMKHK